MGLLPSEQEIKKTLLPLINDYWATRSDKKPHGCPVALKKVHDTYNTLKRSCGNRSMPSANKLGYGDRRDKINESIAHYRIDSSSPPLQPDTRNNVSVA